MPKIIEFVGPRGVGKSFIYKKLMSRLSKNKAIASASKFYPKRTDADFLSAEFIIFYSRYLFDKKLYPKKNGYIFSKNNPEFVSTCWNLLSKNKTKDHNGIDSRFRIAKNLYSYHAKYQTIIDADDNRICITDELLLHTIVQLIEGVNIKDIERFSNKVPLPELVVYLEAPHHIIFERIKKRKTILSHRGMNDCQLNSSIESQMKAYQILIENIKKRGAKILKIDATHDLNKNIKMIINTLKKNNY